MYGKNDPAEVLNAALATVNRSRYVAAATGMVNAQHGTAVNAVISEAIDRFQRQQAVINGSGLPDEQREMAEIVSHNTYSSQLNTVSELDTTFRQIHTRAMLQTNLPDEAWLGDASGTSMPAVATSARPAAIGFETPPAALPAWTITRKEYDQMQHALAKSWADCSIPELFLRSKAKKLGVELEPRGLVVIP